MQKNQLVYMLDRFILIFFLFFSLNSNIYSQCCSAGSPVSASIYVGILEKNSLRINSFYRHSQNLYYYEGTKKLTEYGIYKYTRLDFTSLSIGYGLAKRVSVEFETGYFIDKKRELKDFDYVELGRGIGTGNISFKYCPYKSIPKEIEVTLSGGLKFPFSNENSHDINHPNVELSKDLQPSTHSYGISANFFITKNFPKHNRRLFTNNRIEYNFLNKDYQYGWLLSNSLFISNQLFKRCFAVLEVRNELRGVDKILQTDNVMLELNDRTGGQIVLVSPRIMYAIGGKWNISILYDIPVYRNYNGKQMGLEKSISVSLSKDFSLNKTAKPL
ncbi:MAG: hypothetical protein HY951_02045 [Bacteroidia bacterium]|nr:hypothetical protein [Bacteroidia bacterium]